jgi:hypothetical protein
MEPTCSIVLNDRVLMFHYKAFGWVHIGAATALFVSLGFVSIFFFTKSDKKKDKQGPKKPWRNVIYRVCGVAIWTALALYGLFLLVQGLAPEAPSVRALGGWPLLYGVETACLCAFGVSWLVKGDGVCWLRDPNAGT